MTLHNDHDQNARTPNVGIDIDWQLDQFANHIPALIWASRTDGLCNYFNRYWLEFVGRSMEQELGNGWAENVHRDDLDNCLVIYKHAVEKRKDFRLEYRLKRHDGEFRWILDNGVARYDEAGEFLGFIGTCLDVTEHYNARETVRKQRDMLAQLAIRDELTDLFNRRYFLQHAEIEIQRHKRYRHPLHLMVLDIDDFKMINDTYGHNAGDAVLKSLASAFNRSIRSIDLICRIGGDEFCIIVPESDTDGVIQIAERILEEAENISVPQYPQRKITLSIGISEFNGTMKGVDEWLHRADVELYNAKAKGKNEVALG